MRNGKNVHVPKSYVLLNYNKITKTVVFRINIQFRKTLDEQKS